MKSIRSLLAMGLVFGAVIGVGVTVAMRDHSGDLTAEWPAGGGTLFAVTLPLAPR